MSYKENPHPHQSEKLTFLSSEYIPYQVDKRGKKRFGVITYSNNKWRVKYQSKLPKFGGYISEESIYGSAVYCPNATRNHLKHKEIYGAMPHLVFFDSEEAAQSAGFRECQRCTK